MPLEKAKSIKGYGKCLESVSSAVRGMYNVVTNMYKMKKGREKDKDKAGYEWSKISTRKSSTRG
jgi:hypothetical protein